MTLGGPILQRDNTSAEVKDNEIIGVMLNLLVQVLDPVDKYPDNFLDIGPGMMANITRIATAFPFDKYEKGRFLRPLGGRSISMIRSLNRIAGIKLL
jgi:hypothetical protein